MTPEVKRRQAAHERQAPDQRQITPCPSRNVADGIVGPPARRGFLSHVAGMPPLATRNPCRTRWTNRCLDRRRHQRTAPLPAARRRGPGAALSRRDRPDHRRVLVETVWTLVAASIGWSRPSWWPSSKGCSASRMSVSRTTGSCGARCRRIGTPHRRKARVFALIVFKAQRTAMDSGEALTGVYTFDEAMRRFPRLSDPVNAAGLQGEAHSDRTAAKAEPRWRRIEGSHATVGQCSTIATRADRL